MGDYSIGILNLMALIADPYYQHSFHWLLHRVLPNRYPSPSQEPSNSVGITITQVTDHSSIAPCFIFAPPDEINLNNEPLDERQALGYLHEKTKFF